MTNTRSTSRPYHLLGTAVLGLLVSACSQINPYGRNDYVYEIPPQRAPLTLNYENLSAFENPLATQVGNTTLLLRGRIDLPLQYSFDSNDRLPTSVEANHEISAQTLLNNRWRVGAVYAGQYANTKGDGGNYTDKVAGFVGGSWGTAFGGNVSDQVFEHTRRRRGVGEVDLVGDRALGGVDEWGGGYRGRFGPLEVSGVVDDDANYDMGVSIQRPIGVQDVRFTARHTDGSFLAADGITELDTRSISGVGEYVYGSTRMDIGGGYEQIEDVDRWFASAGVSTKTGVWSFSAEGAVGATDGQKERSVVVGARYDIARGFSATAAVDHQNRVVNINGIDYLNTDDTRLTVRLLYGF